MTIEPEMIHEAEAHVPSVLRGREREMWLAVYLTDALAHPGQVCPCCGVTNLGEDCSELPWVKKRMVDYRMRNKI